MHKFLFPLMIIVSLTENVTAIRLILAKHSRELIFLLNNFSLMKRKIAHRVPQNPIVTKNRQMKSVQTLWLARNFFDYLLSFSSNAGYILLKRELICLKYDESILSIVSFVVLNLQFFSGTPGIFILASEPKPHIS